MRSARAPRRFGARVRAAGFTLLEILVATTLLAAALALAFATLRASSAAAARGEALAQRSERMRAVEGFLRRRVASSLPVAFDMNEQSGVPMRFVGEGDRIRFVADLPNYLGRGGPYLHDVQVVDGARGGLRLQVGFSMVMTNEVIEESDARPPETLADGLREVRFRYRSLTPENRIGEWEDRWQYADRLPLQVAIDIVDDRGDAWPRIVVALPQAASYGGAFAQPTL
ncbi:MAG: prepilin-type N-terminal cleavage/methylation domain-containing protein [Lysobacter sp.]|nr:MAG: prepilin-type N-terminal cleavage/methylation domain-containing protein [Lysobacter sp.]